MYNFELGLHPIWLLPCALVALGCSLFLYFRYTSVWSVKWNITLGIIRFLGVFLLLFLLLSPLIRTVENTVQTPKIHVLVDNSESMLLADKNIKSKVNEALNSIFSSNKKVNFELFDLEKSKSSTDSISYTFGVSDLGKELKNLTNLGAGQNHVATILISDGIVNQGLGMRDFVSPLPIFVLATGDTNQINDLIISDLYVNKSSYRGNVFPIQASIKALGFKGKASKIDIKVDGELVESKNVTFLSNNELLDLSFSYTSKKAGYLKIECNISPLNGEKIITNNTKVRYLEVKDSRKKIAMVAASPHPDLKAIKTSLESLDKYEIELIIMSLNPKIGDLKKFDAFILHQLPSKNSDPIIVNQILKSGKPRWFITGLQTDYSLFDKLNKTISIKSVRGSDEVGGVINANFDLFSTDDFNFDFLPLAPPLKVPYAEIESKAGTKTLFYQQINNLNNQKPLFAYNNVSSNEMVTIGEGIWKWKLFESLENGNAQNFDLLISKAIGLLDRNDSDSQFEVTPQKEAYLAYEKPSFAIIVKNELGELVFDQPIDLIVKSKESTVLKSNFKVSETDPFYRLNTLQEGVYSYQASTKVGDKVFKDAGSFTVNDMKLESEVLKADFDGLRALAKNSGGQFYLLNNFNKDALLKNTSTFVSKINSNEKESYFNELFWVLLIILTLFSLEWIARKVLGDV